MTALSPAAHTTEARSILEDPERLNRIDELRLLDTPREVSLDRLTTLAANLLVSPVALLSIVDDDRQFFKSSVGLDLPLADHGETPLADSLCAHAVVGGEPFIVSDASTDPRIGELVMLGQVPVVAYLGVPLTTADGIRLGALCVIDTQPREWDRRDVQVLTNLAEAIIADIELRRQVEKLDESRQQGRRLEATLRRSHLLQRSILEALDTQVCILDHAGTVVEANRSWLEFVETDPDDSLAAGLGANLLAGGSLFDDVSVDLDNLRTGIRHVLKDERRSFVGCYSPADGPGKTTVRTETLRGAVHPMAIVFRNPRGNEAETTATSPFDS